MQNCTKKISETAKGEPRYSEGALCMKTFPWTGAPPTRARYFGNCSFSSVFRLFFSVFHTQVNDVLCQNPHFYKNTGLLKALPGWTLSGTMVLLVHLVKENVDFILDIKGVHRYLLFWCQTVLTNVSPPVFSASSSQCLTSFLAFHADRDMKVKIPVWISACEHNRLPDHPFGRFQAASTCYFWIAPWKFCCAHTAQADFIRLQIQFFFKLTWISREGLSLLMRAGSLQLQSQQL